MKTLLPSCILMLVFLSPFSPNAQRLIPLIEEGRSITEGQQGPNYGVYSMIEYNEKVLCSGLFTKVNGDEDMNKLACWNGATQDFFGAQNFTTPNVFPLNIEEPALGEENKLQVYPNPSSGTFTLRHSSKVIRQLAIFNLLGELIYFNPMAQNEIELHLDQLQSGTYILRATYDDSVTETTTLVIE